MHINTLLIRFAFLKYNIQEIIIYTNDFYTKKLESNLKSEMLFKKTRFELLNATHARNIDFDRNLRKGQLFY